MHQHTFDLLLVFFHRCTYPSATVCVSTAAWQTPPDILLSTAAQF